MIPYILVFIFMVIGFTFMAAMLHFAQWKKKEGSCGCGRAELEEEYLLSGKLPTTCSRTGQVCTNRK